MSQDKPRPSAGIPRVRERDDDQGIPGVEISRLTSELPTTHGANLKGGLLLTAYTPSGGTGLDR